MINNDSLQNSPFGNGDMETQLWDFIDGSISATEKNTVEKLIAENAEWRAKYQELLEVHQLINATELEHPSLRFTKNVMEEIAKYQIAPAAKNYINKKIISAIGIFFISIIVGFLIYGIKQINWSAASDNKSALGVDLSKVNYSEMFNNSFVNVFMMLNVILGLILLDRYLTNRKQQFMKQAH